MINTIIIPILNQYHLLDRAISSIPTSVENILVINNGNEDYAPPAGRDIRVLQMPSNLGVATSWNLGIKAYPHEPGWLLLNSDAYFPTIADWATVYEEANHMNIVLAGNPPWCCAWIGAEVVQRVGLFCERYYPAYMEDVDYERRATLHNISILHSKANIHHDNSSTIYADPKAYAENQRTHANNRAYYEYRWANLQPDGLPSAAEWSLSTRRMNEWHA